MKNKNSLSRVFVFSMAFFVMIFMLMVSFAYAASSGLTSAIPLGSDSVAPADATVPEFGVIGALTALIVGVVIIMYRRRS